MHPEYADYSHYLTREPHYVFVYGTLKKGEGNDYLLKDSEFLGEAWTDEEFLFCGQGFPRAIRVTDSRREKVATLMARILGEVYVVDDEVLRLLDGLEGHPYMYKRTVIDAFGPAIGKVPNGKVEMYVWNRDLEKLFPSVVLKPTSNVPNNNYPTPIHKW